MALLSPFLFLQLVSFVFGIALNTFQMIMTLLREIRFHKKNVLIFISEYALWNVLFLYEKIFEVYKLFDWYITHTE